MNIWILDRAPSEAARYHHDRHVHNAIQELSEILVLAHIHLDGQQMAWNTIPFVPLKWTIGGSDGGSPRETYSVNYQEYEDARLTHLHHPVAVWARENQANYDWTADLLRSLVAQTTLRFGRTHEYSGITLELKRTKPRNIPIDGVCSPFPMIVHRQFKQQDAVEAYREHYFHTFLKTAKWSVVGVPDWWVRMCGAEARA